MCALHFFGLCASNIRYLFGSTSSREFQTFFYSDNVIEIVYKSRFIGLGKMLQNSIVTIKHIALFPRSRGGNWNDMYASCCYDYDLHVEDVAILSHDATHNTLPQNINNLIIFDSESAQK